MKCRHEPIDRNCPQSCMGLSPYPRRILRAASALGASDPLSWKLDVPRVKRWRDLTPTTGLGTRKRQERSHTWHANQASSLGRVFRASVFTAGGRPCGSRGSSRLPSAGGGVTCSFFPSQLPLPPRARSPAAFVALKLCSCRSSRQGSKRSRRARRRDPY